MTAGVTVRWLTCKRLRTHGLLLAICLWSAFLWNMSKPGMLDRLGNLKGTDFLHLYTLGSLALDHRSVDLYNMRVQSELAAQLVPEAAGIRYLPLYPPQVSLFFAPFAELSYPWALLCWLMLSALVYGLCCYAIWRSCSHLRNYKSIVLILALAFPAFWHLMLWGQTSALALACFTLAYFALHRDHQFLAGLAFGCLVFKPQLALVSALVFLLTLNWRIIAGGLLSAAAQLSAAFLYYGAGPIREWTHVMWNVSNQLPLLEPRLYQTHCLRTFWSLLVPWPSAAFALYIISALVILALTVTCWRGQIPLSLRYSTLLLSTVLLAPHLTVYDLVILAPAFLLLADWIVSQTTYDSTRHLQLLLYLAFVLPLIGPLARWTHLQFSVPVMVAILYVIWSRTKADSSLRFPARIAPEMLTRHDKVCDRLRHG